MILIGRIEGGLDFLGHYFSRAGSGTAYFLLQTQIFSALNTHAEQFM